MGRLRISQARTWRILRHCCRSAVLMLHHINEKADCGASTDRLEQVYREGKVLTRDVGGTSGTKAFADAVIAAMESPVAAK